jgi:citrate lyase beta subunit
MFFKYVNNINKNNSVAVFDLEDAAFIPFNKKQTDTIKSNLRKEITSILSSAYFKKQSIGIRINKLSNANFSKDINLLKKFNKKISWSCIFLPKVQNKSQLIGYIKVLRENEIQFKQVIPIIECQKGMKNLLNILSLKTDSVLNKIAFGHCDYNLDCKNFPYYHHNSIEYFDVISSLVKLIEANGFEFVNSPFLELDNYDSFYINLRYLKNICKNNFSQVTLTLDQTRLCSEFIKSKSKILIENVKLKSKDIEDRKIIAKNIISDYLSNLIPGRGFALIKGDRKLISPQEYISAIIYLKDMNI